MNNEIATPALVTVINYLCGVNGCNGVMIFDAQTRSIVANKFVHRCTACKRVHHLPVQYPATNIQPLPNDHYVVVATMNQIRALEAMITEYQERKSAETGL